MKNKLQIFKSNPKELSSWTPDIVASGVLGVKVLVCLAPSFFVFVVDVLTILAPPVTDLFFGCGGGLHGNATVPLPQDRPPSVDGIAAGVSFIFDGSASWFRLASSGVRFRLRETANAGVTG